MGERAQLNDRTAGSVDDIRAQITQTRNHLTDTVEAIQARVLPRAVASRAANAAREAAERTAQTMAERADYAACQAAAMAGNVARRLKQNPVPPLLVSLGIGGFLVSRFLRSRSSVTRKIGEHTDRSFDQHPYDDIWSAFNQPSVAQKMSAGRRA